MPLAAQIFALIAAVLHVFFFYLESIAFGRPDVWKRFGVANAEHAEAVRPMALNQGFYNLFLAVGTITGVILWHSGEHDAGVASVVFGTACMLLAALVLVISSPKLARAALIQGLAPALAIVLIVVA